MKQIERANGDLMVAVTSDKIGSIASDISEALIDSVLKEGLIKDIPGLGIGVKTFQTVRGIQDYFLLKKILNFLNELKEIPQEKRIDFDKELEEKGQKDVGQKMMFLLSRLDDVSKATMTGKLLSAAILKEISLAQFQKCCHIISNIFIGDLEIINPAKWKASSDLSNKYVLSFVSKEFHQDLFQAGLLQQTIKDNSNYDRLRSAASGSEVKTPPKITYEPNESCLIIMEYCFRLPNSQ